MTENIDFNSGFYLMIFLEKVQKGLDDSANGRINTKEQAKEKLSKWFK
jgi:hypothetical protein